MEVANPSWGAANLNILEGANCLGDAFRKGGGTTKKGGTFRNSEKGAIARGALCKFVANCAPKMRKIGGISFCATARKGAPSCRTFKVNFGQSCANTPFPMLPSANF